MRQTRRAFLRNTAAAGAAGVIAAGAGAGPAILRADDARGDARGGKAGERKTLALVGAGWWGTNILSHALADGRIKVVGLCDVDENQLTKCREALSPLTGDSPREYRDYRELLEKEKPQVVINATPDHWHALITIAALRGGSHVYVEKPIAHTILEGAAMVKAARETGQGGQGGRVVQVGTHRRVSPHNLSARQFVRAGKVGKIGAIKCFVYGGGGGGGGEEKPQTNEEPPAALDWDMWCGPAPLRPFNKKIHPLGHRHFLDYANGQLGDWGIHWIDQVMWIMGREGRDGGDEGLQPRTVFSTGGRSIKGPAVNSDAGQTTDAPDHQVAVYDFAEFTLTWEHRQFGGGGGGALKHQPIGVHFYGTEGTLHLGWLDGWTFYPRDAKEPIVHEDAKFSGAKNSENVAELWRDFMDTIEQGKGGRRPACDIEGGHRATTAALLGMLSLKLGRSVSWDGKTIVGDEEAAKLLKRSYRSPWEYPV